MAKKKTPTTKKEKLDYVLEHKELRVGLMTKYNIEYISFKDKKGYFRGSIKRDADTERYVKKNFGRVIKIKATPKDSNKPKELNVQIYNRKQQKQVLYRMNSKLRNKTLYKREQRKLDLPDTRFRDDALPMIDKKKNIDMLFDHDKIEYKPVKIKKWFDASP